MMGRSYLAAIVFVSVLAMGTTLGKYFAAESCANKGSFYFNGVTYTCCPPMKEQP